MSEHVHVRVSLSEELERAILAIAAGLSSAYGDTHLLHHLQEMERRIMATMKELQDAVAAEDTVIDSVLELVKGLVQKIADLNISNPADAAARDALVTDIKARTDAMAAAVVSGTPAA